MELTLQGIVIRDTLYGENDKLITVLTGEYGKITVLAKGVKSINSKNSPAVQLFCYSTLELSEKNGRYLLTGASVEDNHYGIRDNIEHFSLASYFADVAGTVCTENNDEREMLRLLRNCFYAMAKRKEVPLWKIKAAFEMQCMMINGLTPELSECADCGKPIADAADKLGQYLFSCPDGAFLCPDCLAARRNQDVIPLSVYTVDALEEMIRLPQSRMLRFSVPNEAVRKELTQVCQRYLVCQTGRTYETLRFYNSLCAGAAEKERES